MSEIKDKESWHGHTNAEVENYIKNRLDNSAGYRKILYAELKELRDNNKLVPGMQYRITDYACTTTTAGTISAGHAFDVIVTADDESTLNEVARAIKHEDDTYFADCDLNAWQIWYCLDNDTNMFAWADSTNGKGVIYRMIDEFGNDCPYDFKNIQFYRQYNSSKSLWSTISSDNTGVPCYTFSSLGNSSTKSFSDMSLDASNKVYSNVIKGYIYNKKRTLNNNCFFGAECSSNTFGNNCHSNTFGSYCSFNSFGDSCYNNIFRLGYKYNSLGVSCYNSIFGSNCCNNTFGDNCQHIHFGNDCYRNSFGYSCYANSFGSNCNNNTFGNVCAENTFGTNCYCNTFGNGCRNNYLGNYCDSNSFGNNCSYNTFRVSASTTSVLKEYVCYNHFDDGCSYNVIWNSKTTSSSVRLKNINVNRGVVGTSSSYNMINIDVLNSEQEINVNQYDGVVSIISNISDISNISNKLDKIVELSYSELVTLRDNAQLIPGQQYRIIDYITTTTQENTKSAGHQFDIIVTALDESTLSEEAQAIQNINDGYFDGSNLSAWKIWYCLDNDTTRFAWAGDNVKVDEIEYKSYDSSQCTIKPELINGNAFITPFNFESCVWVDGNNDGFAYSDDLINHDISELVYEWGYFTDENGVKQLCIYKSDARYYEEEGQPDYGDKYLYRGVVNVDGTEYDYWQKWDDSDNGIYINGDDYVYATTRRIISNPEAYSATIKTEGIYAPGKGVIYRMIDEWNNDIPYDFKNIQYNGSWGYWAYTFNWINDNSDNTCEDLSVAQYAHTNDEGIYSRTYGNVIKPCESDSSTEYGYPFKLNTCVFLNSESYNEGYFCGCYSNTFGNDCYNNTFGNDCYDNTFANDCYDNTFANDCYDNTFANDCSNNSFGNNCYYNTFGNNCSSNTFRSNCSENSFGKNCYHNSFRDYCDHNSFRNDCSNNFFGIGCQNNSFGNNCDSNSFRVSANITATLKDYVQYNHFDDGCSYNVIWNNGTTSSSVLLKNVNINRGVKGADSLYSYNMININTLNQDYEIQVAKNSKGQIKIYCEADLIV